MENSQCSGKIAFLGRGGERVRNLPANVHVGDGENQTAAFSEANFL